MNNNYSKPCLVEARQGFSVLYNNKPLYSKYNPEEPIKKIIDKLTILPNTLVICFSPLLGYGLAELFNKLPESCHVLCIEYDSQLFDFSLTCEKSLLKSFLNSKNNLTYISSQSPVEVAKLINNLSNADFPKIGNFKRALPIDLSGGALLNPDFYKTITTFVDDSISQFWKNRTTIMKLGRLYAGNFFKNLKDIAQSENLEIINFGNIASKAKNKILLVLGTGLSLDNFLPELSILLQNKLSRKKLFIISVDASLPVLSKYDITPDLVVGVEGQLAIEKAYIGFAKKNINFSSDLLSRPSIKRYLTGEKSFFLSCYTEEAFFLEFSNFVKELSIPVIPPLGSVGLVALELAILLRHNSKNFQNIFCCGLDFTFRPGKTHCKGSHVHSHLLANCSKLKTTEQLVSSFTTGNFPVRNVEHENWIETIITSKTLFNYGQHFSQRFSQEPNIFDLSTISINHLPTRKKADFFEYLENFHLSEEDRTTQKVNSDMKSLIQSFLQTQNNYLQTIKNILTGQTKSENLEFLLTKCGYLYLHFPDGHLGAKLSQDFLKRIRAEVDYFLKIIN